MAPYICCIDGNISAGKSSVLSEIERRGYYVFKEDIDSWKWALDNYYNDPERWGFTIQVAVLNSMMDQRAQILTLDTPFVFVERSPMSSMVFASVLAKRGYLNPDELALLKAFHAKISWKPDMTLLLDTPLTTCFKRMGTRGRDCEEKVDISYLQDVEDAYKCLSPIMLDHSGTCADVADRVLALVDNHH